MRLSIQLTDNQYIDEMIKKWNFDNISFFLPKIFFLLHEIKEALNLNKIVCIGH